MDGVACAERVGASAHGCLCQQRLIDGTDIEAAPKTFQVFERTPELCRGQALSLTHPNQGGRRLSVRNRRAAYAAGVVVGPLGLGGAGLIDQQLDQGAGIEIKTQRRPSAT
jgi:hypothetical protein